MRATVRRLIPVIGCLSVLVLGAGAFAEEDSFAATVTLISAANHLRVDRAGQPVPVAVYGILCPDRAKRDGKAAKAFAAQHALGQEVQVAVVKRMGEIVSGNVKLPDGSDLAELLLSAGWAQWDRVAAPDKQAFQDLENAAKEKGVGMWVKPNRNEPRGSLLAPKAPKPSAEAKNVKSLPALKLKGEYTSDEMAASQSRVHQAQVEEQTRRAQEQAEQQRQYDQYVAEQQQAADAAAQAQYEQMTQDVRREQEAQVLEQRVWNNLLGRRVFSSDDVSPYYAP